MKKQLIVKTTSLKDFLSLFDENDQLNDLELGDTGYPSSGFVDENILENRRKINEIMAFSYDFNSLVHFKCRINNLEIELKNGEFEIIGMEWKIRKLRDKITEFNALNPHKKM